MIARPLGLKLPVYPAKGYSISVEITTDPRGISARFRNGQRFADEAPLSHR
jgi:hypothetical protein